MFIGGKIRPILRWILTFVFVFELLYISAGNYSLNGGYIKDKLNRHPEKRSYDWDSARTYIPGFISIRGFSMEMRTARIQWQAAVERARLHIGLTALAKRTFEINYCRAEGAVFKLRRIAGDKTHDAGTVNATPESSPNNTTDKRPVKKPWRFRMTHSEFDRLNDVTIDDYHLIGTGRMSGSLDIIPRSTAHAFEVCFSMSGADLVLPDQKVVSGLDCSISEMEIGPYNPRENRGLKAFQFISGSLEASGEAADLEFLRYYFQNADWLRIRGSGRFKSNITLKKGLLDPGSGFSMRTDSLAINLRNYYVTGKGIIDAGVETQNGSAINKLEVSLRDIELTNPGHWDNTFHGMGLKISAESSVLSIAEPDPKVTLSISLDESQIPDLEMLNSFLPGGSGIHILPDSKCYLSAVVDIQKNLGRCRLDLMGSDVGIQMQRSQVRGDLSAAIMFHAADPDLKVFNLDDAVVRLENTYFKDGFLKQADGWWAEARVPGAAIELVQPLKLRADLQFKMLDTRPALHLFSPKTARWFDRYIVFKDVTGRTEIELDQNIVLHNISLQGTGVLPQHMDMEGLTIDARCDRLDFSNGWTGLDLNYHLPVTVLDKLEVLNGYIPDSVPIEIEKGSVGSIGADIRVKNGRGSGSLDLKGKNVRMRVKDETMQGAVNLKIDFKTRDISSRRIDISGTKLTLDGIAFQSTPEAEPWNGELRIKSGLADIARPLGFESELELELLDTSPVISLFDSDYKSVRMLRDLLTIRNIRGTTGLKISPGGISAKNLNLSADNLLIKAHFTMRKTLFSGIFYTRLHSISLGLEVKENKKNYRFIQPRKWFENYQWMDSSRAAGR